MSAHLCDEQIHRLLGGTLPDDELFQAEAHLWQCPDCRDALRRRTEPMLELPPLGAPRSEGAAPRSVLPAVPGYEILGELGRGGMALVYQARQLQPDRIVALKMIRAIEHAGPIERLRFQIETEAVARLQHTHIVQLYEAGEVGGQPFFSLEFCYTRYARPAWKKQRPSPRDGRRVDRDTGVGDALRVSTWGDPSRPEAGQRAAGRARAGGEDHRLRSSQAASTPRIPRCEPTGCYHGHSIVYGRSSRRLASVHDTGPATDVYGLGAAYIRVPDGSAAAWRRNGPRDDAASAGAGAAAVRRAGA